MGVEFSDWNLVDEIFSTIYDEEDTQPQDFALSVRLDNESSWGNLVYFYREGTTMKLSVYTNKLDINKVSDAFKLIKDHIPINKRVIIRFGLGTSRDRNFKLSSFIKDDNWINYVLAMWEFYNKNFSRSIEDYLVQVEDSRLSQFDNNVIKIEGYINSGSFDVIPCHSRIEIKDRKFYLETPDEKLKEISFRECIDNITKYYCCGQKHINGVSVLLDNGSKTLSYSDGMSEPMTLSYIKYILTIFNIC